MKYLATIAALALAAPAAAQDGPKAAFEWLKVTTQPPEATPEPATGLAPLMEQAPDWASLADGTLLIAMGRQSLAGAEPTIIGQDVASGHYTGSTLLDYGELMNGDVAGLVARADAEHWVSIQVERIEPADLIAVRLRDGEASSPAGRLIFTTALPGSFDHRVRLRIDANDGRYRLLFAQENGLWQILAENVHGPAVKGQAGPVLIGLFGMDGADPPTATDD